MAAEVLLFSGGMDSVALAHAYPEATLLHVNIGTPSQQAEGRVIKRIGDALGRWIEFVNVPLSRYELPNKILPIRNAILALVASQYAPKVLLGSTAGDTTHDKDETWAAQMTGLIRWMSQDNEKSPYRWIGSGNAPPVVEVPFRTMTKAQILRAYIDTDGRESAMRASRSCYETGTRECGKCRSCFRKWVAFQRCGVLDWCDFEQDPLTYSKDHLKKDRGAESVDAFEAVKETAP